MIGMTKDQIQMTKEIQNPTVIREVPDLILDGRFRPRGLPYSELRPLRGRGGVESRCIRRQCAERGGFAGGLDLAKARPGEGTER